MRIEEIEPLVPTNVHGGLVECAFKGFVRRHYEVILHEKVGNLSLSLTLKAKNYTFRIRY